MKDLHSLFDDLAADAPVVGDIDRAIAEGARRRRRQAGLIGVAASVVLLLLVVGLGLRTVHGSPEPSQQPSNGPTTPALVGPGTWSSSLLGYRIAYPAGWRLTPARTPWAFDPSGGWPADSSRDVFRSPGKPLFTVASQQLPAGMSPGQWLQSYVSGETGANGGSSGSQTCWPAPQHWLAERIGGHHVQIHGQSEYCAFTEAVTFEGHRAYVFTGFAGTLPGVFDMNRFRSFIRSAQLTPGTASSASTG